MSAKGLDHCSVEIRAWCFALGCWDSKPWTEKSPLTLPETKMAPNKARNIYIYICIYIYIYIYRFVVSRVGSKQVFHQRPTSHRSLPLAAVHRLPYPLYSHFPPGWGRRTWKRKHMRQSFFGGFTWLNFIETFPNLVLYELLYMFLFLIGNIPVQNKVQKRPVHFHPSFFWRVQSLILRGDCFLAQKKTCSSSSPKFARFTERNLPYFMTDPWDDTVLGDGFKYVLFSPLFGEMNHFD